VGVVDSENIVVFRVAQKLWRNIKNKFPTFENTKNKSKDGAATVEWWGAGGSWGWRLSPARPSSHSRFRTRLEIKIIEEKVCNRLDVHVHPVAYTQLIQLESD
jgi:hypothetical protein